MTVEEEVELQSPAALPIDNVSKTKGQSVAGGQVDRTALPAETEERFRSSHPANMGKQIPDKSDSSVLSPFAQDRVSPATLAALEILPGGPGIHISEMETALLPNMSNTG